MKINLRSALLLMVMLGVSNSFSCAKKTGIKKGDDGCIVNGVNTCNTGPARITINLGNEQQTMQSFGASDCWTTKFIGKWNDVTKKNQIADYLFSMEADQQGNPKGIGLTLWRFNIGAGSYEQGSDSGIPDEFRREECFLDANNNYNWNKQAGQQWFLSAAKARGVKDFLAFSVSPPVQFTQNNKAYGLANSHLNLTESKKNAFADFLVSVLKHFKSSSTPFNYLSPFNEPQWNWGENPSQEGTGATNAEIADFIRLLGPKMKAAGLATTICLGEANQWNSLDANNSDGRGDQLNQFFNKSSANYIGDVPSMEHLLSAHSYFTTCPGTDLISYRQHAADKQKTIDPSLHLWQSEFGILGDICGQLNGYPKNTGIDYGLYVAKVIHHDLTVANVTSWQWWLAVDTYNYSDGLVYINDPSGGYDLNSMKTNGLVSDSKQLWCLGNYSRFIRPGMIRINAALSDVTDPVLATGTQMVSAYKDPASKQLVIVLINMSTESKQYTVDPGGSQLAGNTFDVYTTTVLKNLKKSTTPIGTITLEPRSVTTLTAHYQ
ncbi:O-glycosyl hydrolase [Mucilaginibacter sp. OAE612]|uniref:glycoside hydrolase n=1 Tax=Mucilaginibacter sp. OAE612 TaxID=3156444 RepID=UPI00359D7507